jgi:hypothetical protein
MGRNSMVTVRSVRYAVAAVLAITLSLVVLGVDALADAGNPILGTIKGTAVDNGNGTVTISVKGEWNWLSHNSDCNFDRAATGVGIVWNDPTEPGFLVVKGSISAGVGIASLRPGDTVNTIDEMVHPVDRGNVPEGYTSGTWMSTAFGYPSNAAGDYPSGQSFNDPTPPGPTTANVAAWRGGCGREPLTATASKTGGTTCGTTPATTTCSPHPWGSWGYEKTYSHTYLKGQLPSRVCVNFYDVHGGGKFGTNSFQVPNGTKEIDVNGNGDNSIQTNAFNVNDGANCVSFFFPSITTSATSGHPNDSIHDTATITGLRAGESGTVTFTAYGPKAAEATPDCTGANITTTRNVTDNGTNDSDSTSGKIVVTSADLTAPVAPGRYFWIAAYHSTSSASTQDASTACGDTGETSDVTQIPTDIATRQFGYPQDRAEISASGGGDLAGTVTFRLYDTLAHCTADGVTPATGLLYSEVQAIGGASPQSAATNNTTFRLISSATVYWRVTYLSANPGQTGRASICTENTAVAFNGDDPTITVP